MILNGEIKIKGPGLIKKLLQGGKVVFEEASDELILSASNSYKEDVDFDIWIELDKDAVSISTSISDESEIVDNHFVFELKNQKDHCIGLVISVSQMKALVELFQSYITAFDSLQRCREISIKAKSV